MEKIILDLDEVENLAAMINSNDIQDVDVAYITIEMIDLYALSLPRLKIIRDALYILVHDNETYYGTEKRGEVRHLRGYSREHDELRKKYREKINVMYKHLIQKTLRTSSMSKKTRKLSNLAEDEYLRIITVEERTNKEDSNYEFIRTKFLNKIKKNNKKWQENNKHI